MRQLGANTVRLYSVPSLETFDELLKHGLRAIIDVPWEKHRCFFEDWTAKESARRQIRTTAEVAAAQLEREGISVEIIDLRSLSPYDWEAIAATVRKTHRIIVAYEDMLSWGYGAEIAARIADELFGELDAPVRRVAAMDTFCAYQPKLEDVILPQTSHITAAVKQLLEY